MFALRCADLNFCEKDPGTGTCGIQEVLFTTPAPEDSRSNSSGARNPAHWKPAESNQPGERVCGAAGLHLGNRSVGQLFLQLAKHFVQRGEITLHVAFRVAVEKEKLGAHEKTAMQHAADVRDLGLIGKFPEIKSQVR